MPLQQKENSIFMCKGESRRSSSRIASSRHPQQQVSQETAKY